MQLKTILVLAGGILAISTSSILVRYSAPMPSLLIAFYRMMISALVLGGIFYHQQGRLQKITSAQWYQAAFGGLLLALHFAVWITSLRYTSVAASVVLVCTNPIWVALFGHIFLKEKTSRTLQVSILLSLSGSLVLVAGDSWQNLAAINREALFGNLLALAGGIFAAGYYLNGSRMRKSMEILPYTLTVYGFAAVFLILFLILTGTSPDFCAYSPTNYLFVVLLALIPQLAGHTAFNWALKYFKTSAVVIAILGEPIGSSLLAWLLFGESITLIQAGGIILILSAVLLAFKKK